MKILTSIISAIQLTTEAVTQRCSVIAKFAGKHLCQSHFFNRVAGLRPAFLLKRETLAQMLSFEFCKISRNTLSHRTTPTPVDASVTMKASEAELEILKILIERNKYYN